MRDLSMHILDIVMNSIKANANLIEINIDDKNELLNLTITDNGKGMSEDVVNKVYDPFYTTRTTRKVGLGIPLLHDNVKKTGGTINISSEINKGTVVNAKFNKKHIDCIPLGDIDETIISLLIIEPNVDFIYKHNVENKTYELNTREIKMILGEVPINQTKVIQWLKEDLKNKFN